MSDYQRDIDLEKCQEQFEEEPLKFILDSKTSMRDLLLYIDEQPKPLGLKEYIARWLETEEGIAFEEKAVQDLFESLQDGPEYEPE